jgi:SAM-dependent methyltransferase
MDSVSDAELFNHSFLKSLHEKLIIGKEISSVKKVQGGRAGALLDIGCGTGWTTELWKNAGYSVSGLEPSPARAEMAERRGVRILGGYLEEYTGEELFDVIVLRHVVEHFGEPYEALSRVRGMLRSGGVLVLVVPNIDCIGRFLFQERWSWILPWHCNFFNPKSARTIVERAGLAIEKCYQTPSPLWYPESMARSFPNSRLVRKLFGSRGILPLVLCAPIVLAGFLTGRNDNLTLLARRL